MFVFIQWDFTRANNGSTAPMFISWFWKNWLPYYYIYRWYYWGDWENYFKQWNIPNYKVCDEILTIENNSLPWSCVNQNVWASTSEILWNFINTLSSEDYYYFEYTRPRRDKNQLNLDFCISNSFVGSSLCFNVNWNTILNNSIWLSGDLTFDWFDTSYLENPPWFQWNWESSWWQRFDVYTWSRLEWMLWIEGDYTNSDIIRWYEGIWLFSDLCYWWFPIDNIFQPSEQFEDFTWYKAWTGATIFELYNLYPWFNNMTQFLNTILTRYQNWQINSFKTEPKALLMVWSQLNVAWIKTSYVAEYCDLYFNSVYSDIYTWNTVDSVRVKNYLNNANSWWILTTNSWNNVVMQSVDNVWVFSSWNSFDFDASTFFSNIMNEITTKLNNPTKWWTVWILPWYIVAVLLWLIFIRLISH